MACARNFSLFENTDLTWQVSQTERNKMDLEMNFIHFKLGTRVIIMLTNLLIRYVHMCFNVVIAS